MPVPAEPGCNSNQILSALPEDDYRRIVEYGELVRLQTHSVLYESNEPVRYVHFMLNGMASVVTAMQDGTSIEVRVVGREGMIGLVALESDTATVPTRAFIQISGHAIKVPSLIVRSEFNRGGPLLRSMLGYFQFVMVQLSQSSACNRLHNLEKRMSRWLLMVHDRVEQAEFPITHESLSQMLGTRRSSVTLAAGALQRLGLIEYRRGKVRILNRDGLEKFSCECYPIIKTSWDTFHRTIQENARMSGLA